jgi:hypothetical protein
MRLRLFLPLSVALGLALPGIGALMGAPAPEAVAQKKHGFTLLNPTTPDLMRELNTDRPDQTESPYTVDAGHFQLEMDFFNYGRDHDTEGGADVRTRALSIAPVNLKLGLLNNVDLQLMVDPYVRVRAEDRVSRLTAKASGFGDVTTRLKVNLWGNDGGQTAFGLMPFVKWPLKASNLRNGKTEGGLILPLAVELPNGWGMGAMTEIDFVRNDANTGYDREWLNSVTFSRDITEKLGGYFEFVVVTGSAPGFKWQGQFDVGLTFAVSRNMQLDAGCNFGVTKSAPDYNPFVGLSYRY